MCLLVGDVIMDLDFGHCEALRQGRADSGAVAILFCACFAYLFLENDTNSTCFSILRTSCQHF